MYFLTGTGVGGIGKFVNDVVSKFDSSISLTTVALGDDNTPLAKTLKDKGKFISFPGWSIKLLLAIYKELKSEKYDLIHVHAGFWSYIVLIIAKLGKVPVRIAHSHSADSFSDLHGLAKFIYVISRVLNSFVVTHYFACSNHACKNTFGEKILRSKKYYRILNPVDERFFRIKSGKQIREEFHIPKDAIVACHVGYFGFHKNHDFLIELANLLKSDNVWWLLVGEGYRKNEVINKASSLKLEKVIFTGNRNDIPDILDASSIFVFPSKLEGLGTVVMEAQACGIPSIVSENVTMETDMGLHLVKQLRLNEMSRWKTEILNSLQICSEIEGIYNAFINNHATVDSCADFIIGIYRELTHV